MSLLRVGSGRHFGGTSDPLSCFVIKDQAEGRMYPSRSREAPESNPGPHFAEQAIDRAALQSPERDVLEPSWIRSASQDYGNHQWVLGRSLRVGSEQAGDRGPAFTTSCCDSTGIA